MLLSLSINVDASHLGLCKPFQVASSATPGLGAGSTDLRQAYAPPLRALTVGEVMPRPKTQSGRSTLYQKGVPGFPGVPALDGVGVGSGKLSGSEAELGPLAQSDRKLQEAAGGGQSLSQDHSEGPADATRCSWQGESGELQLPAKAFGCNPRALGSSLGRSFSILIQGSQG